MVHPTRMLHMARGKAKTIPIKLNSTAGTGYFYRTTKNVTENRDKLILKKYDPVVQRHVLFKESKINSGRKK
eukprot:CAMPEP_0198140556 /NCGR_PEP_ID=MMETSP1443-20131203/3707_1 /TAXON_ID=186043 /ORGANISM="Entomoneis sp., Strain CCMP2396" /LENGTH=71 /DNA_ID=CAMNT_0043803027 /DNA_START=163 /DNA_END=378 /DNA_ORIENTATION=+